MNKNENIMRTLEFKEGQTYICKRDDLTWWTLDKEYKVQTFNSGDLCITDDDGTKWYVTNNLMNQVFKLKEKIFDLNNTDNSATKRIRWFAGR